MMTAAEVLIWLRGPGLALAIGFCCFGVVLRLFEIFGLGRRQDFSVPRRDSPGSGLRTVFARSPPPGMLRRAPLTYVGGYVFHLGLFVTIFLYVPHIQVIKGLTGLSWPGLPSAVVDLAAAASIVALVVLLVSRLGNPVKRLISGPGDYAAWVITFLPLASGYLAYHHVIFDYTSLLVLHVVSVEILLAALPFTKLIHTLTLFVARWYTGQAFGRKGVAL